MYGRVRVSTLKGFENVLDYYTVDKYGNVYSKDNELKQALNTSNYFHVRLKIKGIKKYKTAFIHRLVALAFVVEGTNEQDQVDHIDGNRHNNYYKNLRWVTKTENMRNPITIQRCKEGSDRKPCFVYDFRLNYVGNFESLKDAEKEIGRTVRGLNTRVKEYYILEDTDLNRVLDINRKCKVQSVVITDITTNEKMYFYSNREARRFFHGRINVTDAIKYNWTVKGKYKIRSLNYKRLISMLDL